MSWWNRYRTFDCRDGRHDACATCDCLCHKERYAELRVMPSD